MTHSITVSKGETRGEVSHQWYSRPEDQKFLSLNALRAQCKEWADQSYVEEFKPADVLIKATPDDVKALSVIIGEHGEFDLTHFAFNKIASMAGAPGRYLRNLPPALIAANLRYGLLSADQDNHAAYLRQNGTALLRGITSPKYGRIMDYDIVDAVQKIAGDGTGDTNWKVPGMIDWSSMTYNSEVDITTDTTTLYASDRDIFLFLVDDRNPIEVGKLPNGEPDLMFRGFYVWNSEVGDRTFGIAQFYLRGVCQNRNLWGVEGFEEITFKHTSGAPEKFITQAAPKLLAYAESGTDKVVAGVKAAKAAIVSEDDEARIDFLTKLGFSMKQARSLIGVGVAEEGHAPVSVWDHAQAITAQARRMPLQDDRVTLEGVAGKLLDKVVA